LPTFSIVTPVFNREAEVVRCLHSCVRQESADFEVVVVDDGSTDRSYDAAASVLDPRIRLLRHSSNQGQGPARNTAVRAARGEWVIFLDSDDELLPGGLAQVQQKAETADSSVDRLAFAYRRDDGRSSPLPRLPEGLMEYPAYVRWLENRELWDFVSCARRSTFESVPQPSRYWADQSLYHLDFALRFRTFCCSDRVAVVHTGAPNRASQLRRTRRLSLENARELGAEMDLLFERHGVALRKWAPGTHQKFLRLRASYHYLAGERSAGLQVMAQCLKATPLLAEAWGLALLGFAPRDIFAVARSRRRAET
jgi:glycosyltransferase involved in cell wall biosynthesis